MKLDDSGLEAGQVTPEQDRQILDTLLHHMQSPKWVARVVEEKAKLPPE